MKITIGYPDNNSFRTVHPLFGLTDLFKCSLFL